MLVIDNGDKIRGDASVAAVVDYTLHGLIGVTLTQLADGQLADAIGDLYTSVEDGTALTAMTITNTDSAPRTINIYLTPDGGTARRLIPKDMSLGAGYSLIFDGQRFSVLDTTGGLVSTSTVMLDDTPGGTDGEITKAPTSNVMYDHGVDPDQHHPQSHDAISHSDITVSGAAIDSAVAALHEEIHNHAGDLVSSINGLNDDVTISGLGIVSVVEDGQVIKVSIPVETTNPQDADLLVYNSTTGKWENEVAPPGGGASASDVVPLPSAQVGAAGSGADVSREDHVHEGAPGSNTLILGSSRRHVMPGWSFGGQASLDLAVGELLFIPIYVPRTIVYDRIGIQVNTAVAASLARLGIYNPNAAGTAPGSLVLDAGTVSTATTGIKEITISQSLSPGFYFLSIVRDAESAVRIRGIDTTTVVYGMPVSGKSLSVGSGPRIVIGVTTGRAGDVAGGLPDPAPALSSAGKYPDYACIWMREPS